MGWLTTRPNYILAFPFLAAIFFFILKRARTLQSILTTSFEHSNQTINNSFWVIFQPIFYFHFCWRKTVGRRFIGWVGGLTFLPPPLTSFFWRKELFFFCCRTYFKHLFYHYQFHHLSWIVQRQPRSFDQIVLSLPAMRCTQSEDNFFRCSLPKAMSISRSDIFRKKKKKKKDQKMKMS